jgi:hypothetical protein
LRKPPKLKVSPLGGIVARDGITVHVEIYRLVERDESGTLEVTDHEGWIDRLERPVCY